MIYTMSENFYILSIDKFLSVNIVPQFVYK